MHGGKGKKKKSSDEEVDQAFHAALEKAEDNTDLDDYMGRKAFVERELGRECTELECEHIDATIQDDEDGEHEEDGEHSYKDNDSLGSQKRVGLEDLLGSPGPERDKKLERMRREREERQRKRDEVRGLVPEEDEEALGYSPMHGARPKLQGVPLYR